MEHCILFIFKDMEFNDFCNFFDQKQDLEIPRYRKKFMSCIGVNFTILKEERWSKHFEKTKYFEDMLLAYY